MTSSLSEALYHIDNTKIDTSLKKLESTIKKIFRKIKRIFER